MSTTCTEYKYLLYSRVQSRALIGEETEDKNPYLAKTYF